MSNEKSIERASNKVTRRRMLQGLGMATGALMLDMGLPRPLKAGNMAGQATGMAQAEEVKLPWYDLGIIGDPLMDQRLLWYLSATWQDMADIGECLETASRIKAGYGIFLTQYPQLLQLLEADPEAFNAAVWEFVKEIPAYNWWFKATMWKHGATSPADLMIKLKDFTNVDIVDKVTCQVLIMDGEAEDWSVGQAKKVYDALSCPKEYMLFTAEDTGLVHCQTGALAIASQRMFDWLDEHI